MALGPSVASILVWRWHVNSVSYPDYFRSVATVVKGPHHLNFVVGLKHFLHERVGRNTNLAVLNRVKDFRVNLHSCNCPTNQITAEGKESVIPLTWLHPQPRLKLSDPVVQLHCHLGDTWSLS